MDFLYTTPPLMVSWQAIRADKVLKIVKEDFDNTCKKSYWLYMPFFHEFFYYSGGWYPLDDIDSQDISQISIIPK